MVVQLGAFWAKGAGCSRLSVLIYTSIHNHHITLYKDQNFRSAIQGRVFEIGKYVDRYVLLTYNADATTVTISSHQANLVGVTCLFDTQTVTIA